MYKMMLILLLVTLISCNLDDENKDNDEAGGIRDLQEYAIGSQRKASKTIEGAELDTGLEICRALEDMRISTSSGDRQVYRLQERDCTGRNNVARTVNATVIDRLGQSLELRSNSGLTLYFQDILSDNHPLLSSLCNDINNGSAVTDTYRQNNGLYYQVRFRNRDDGRWIQFYEFDRSDRVRVISSANIATRTYRPNFTGQTLYRLKSTGCRGSNAVRALSQEFIP